MSIKVKDMDFPKTVNFVKWEQYLKRNLVKSEKNLLIDMKSEVQMNRMLCNLHKVSDAKYLHVPILTEQSGNCMFESLIYHELMPSEQSLRNLLGLVMLKFADYKNFFPNQDETLREIFNMSNEITHVFSQDDKCFYKYSFETMCCDLTREFSWTRLPTQLILMVTSFIFKINITIIDDSSTYEHKINMHCDDNIKTVYMGHLGEMHYVPLQQNNDDIYDELYYDDIEYEFYKWGTKMWKHKQVLINDNQHIINNYCHQETN
jgi:hypothetical protein